MTWTEIRSKTDDLLESARSYMITRFSENYDSINDNSITLFKLPDGCTMHIDIMRGHGFDCLVMEYIAENDNDDGDLYSPEDFETPNDMFAAMLEETKRS